MKEIVKLLPPGYLGFALAAFADITWTQWEFYAILVPFFVLVNLTDSNKSKDERTSKF